jgi:Lon protease-like protein
MPLNRPYAGIADLPTVVPVFPLEGVLLLPRGELPLNVFEPRYIAMIDDAIKSNRLIGMIQPANTVGLARKSDLESVGCLGRITQLAETGDGRYILSLTGVGRFRVIEELAATTLYRQCNIDTSDFQGDLAPAGVEGVDRAKLVQAFRAFAKARDLKIDWAGVQSTPIEVLVNTLSMMSPFGPADKQLLLEAPDLGARALALIAIADQGVSPADAKPTTLH